MLFGRRKKKKKIDDENFGKSLQSILDSYDADLVIVKNEGCEVLFMNEAALKRVDPEMKPQTKCKGGYAGIFPELCKDCPSKADMSAEPVAFDMKDKEGHIFSVNRRPVTWVDGSVATAYVIRDVDEERAAKQKMYYLAYIDQLTGVPNRQKLKEDFEETARDIEKNRVSGIVVIFDLDNFKSINDNYGHNTGDEMLRRITVHLESDAAFKGRLYRLGGDEFVLLFKDKPTRFSSLEEFRSYYMETLSKALLSYTMPNIDDRCTLSMGVSFFPAHGATLSELLRKADIALYKAKEEGRNKIVFFEDKYDASKKFKDMYINMQPIMYNNGSTFGYELVDNDKSHKDEDETLSLSEIDRTLDALGLNDIRDKTRYFIAYSKQLFNKAVLKNLPKDKFVIQIKASDEFTKEQIKRFRQLRSYGYTLSLSDIGATSLDPELLELADYCKFAPNGMSMMEQMRLISANPSKTFIAVGVSDNLEFTDAQRRGFKLYQGFYFDQPVVVKKEKDIEPLKANYYRLLQLTSTDDYVDFKEISEVISSDVALSYKLLRLLNSASVGLRTKVSSILMAVAFLGEDNLKKWISVLALRGISNEKPIELVRMSLIRARFGEILAPYFKPPRDARHIFMTGLLSLLHIALDKTKEELLDEIPVDDKIRESLLEKDGPYSDMLEFFKNYEYANWDEITRFSVKNSISNDIINDAYIKAVKWTNDLIDA